MRKIEKIITDLDSGEVKYRVLTRKSILHKWEPIEFTIVEEGKEDETTDLLTIEQLGEYLHWYCADNKEVDNDLKEVLRQHDAKMHEKPYQIAKMHDDSPIVDILSTAKEIGELSDGYHTFNQLYDFRREYNAALVNSGLWPAHKSKRHHDGELCFGGGWFIVMIDTPYGQISNHYEEQYWHEFKCPEKEVADEWDGHTEKDVLKRLQQCNLNLFN